jgi:hypothetical protein
MKSKYKKYFKSVFSNVAQEKCLRSTSQGKLNPPLHCTTCGQSVGYIPQGTPVLADANKQTNKYIL